MKNSKKTSKLFLIKATLVNFNTSSESMLKGKGGFSYLCLLTKLTCTYSELGACKVEKYSKPCDA